MMFCITINVAAGRLLPKFEGALLVLHIVGFFAVLIPLLTLGPKGDPKEVFTTFFNLGGWSSQGLSFCIGIMGSVFAFVGTLRPQTRQHMSIQSNIHALQAATAPST